MIEIKNIRYEQNPKYHLATFDTLIPQWGISINNCRLLEKEAKKWIALPEKANRRPDGSYDKPSPYFSFEDKSKEKRFKEAVLAEVIKIFRPEPSKPAQTPVSDPNRPAFSEQAFPF